jgi:hypothetical protein
MIIRGFLTWACDFYPDPAAAPTGSRLPMTSNIQPNSSQKAKVNPLILSP